MDIQLVRIDDRLVHGQVATAWAKQTQVERILVVSDVVAQDALRKALLVRAAPPGVKVNVLPVEKLIAIWNHPQFFARKVMLLFTNPQDVYQVVANHLPIHSVNIGGMSFQVGKKMITNAVAVDEKDVAAFVALHQKQLELEIRKVPADHKVELMPLLKKAKLIDEEI